MRHDECCGHGTGSLFLSFLLGGIVGAGAALLLAPKSGLETREKLLGLADTVRGRTEDYIDETKTKVTSTVEKGKGYLQEKKSVLSAAVEAGKEAYEKEKERLAKEQNA